MPGFHIEHVMLKYLINYKCGSVVKEVINTYEVSKGRSDGSESTTSRQRRQHCFPKKLSNPVSLRRIFTACILGALVICEVPSDRRLQRKKINISKFRRAYILEGSLFRTTKRISARYY